MRAAGPALALCALALCALTALLPACAGHTQEVERERAQTLPAPLPPGELEHVPAEGSLWRGNKSKRFLAFENRATRVGDLVTVLIEEQAVAQDNASTALARDSSYDATLDSGIALQTLIARPILNLLNMLGFTDQRNDPNPSTELEVVQAETSSDYEGTGKVKREASFQTKVACMVTGVTDSGLLKIEGERHLTLNNETQIIRLSGYVRPEDVQIDNTIPSTLIASADIHYGGRGAVADHQRVPWLMRVFQVILPF